MFIHKCGEKPAATPSEIPQHRRCRQNRKTPECGSPERVTGVVRSRFTAVISL